MDKHLFLQKQVIEAAIAVCENAAYLPDGNAQVPSELAESLGSALVKLSDFEENSYKKFFIHPDQIGLNSAQVSLQRLSMTENEVKIEQAIDLVDQLYLGFFDQCIADEVYISLAIGKGCAVQFVNSKLINQVFEFVQSLEKEA